MAHRTAVPEAGVVRTMASALESTLRRDIIAGRLEPGSKLRVRELGELYDAGPIPLREALSRLSASGFVVTVDQKGFRVAEVSLEEFRDITQTRQDIERLALTRAMRRRDVEWEGELLAAHHRLQQLPIFESANPVRLNAEWELAHSRFHDKLISGCQSQSLIQFAAALRDRGSRYRHLMVATLEGDLQDAAREATREHEAILHAVLSHDVELAVSLLINHLGATASMLADALTKMRKIV
ncbi:GntR family transcriptional regulator [Paraburkholderia sp. 2C]